MTRLPCGILTQKCPRMSTLLSTRNTMSATYEISHFLVAALKRQRETDEINLIMFYLTNISKILQLNT